MKAIKNLPLIMAVMLFSSCTNTYIEESLTRSSIYEDTNYVGNILSFDSIEQMEYQISELCLMSQNEVANWYKSKRFESQLDAMYRVASELENAKSIEEANEIKSRYTSYFLFNENKNDNDQYNPYLPHNKHLYALVCNIEGKVIINNEVISYNTLNDVLETDEYANFCNSDTRAVEQRTNFLYSEIDDRKFWAEGRLDSNEVVAIEFTAKKKTALLGWIKYKTQYHISMRQKNNYWESFSPDFVYYLENADGGLWTVEFASGTLLAVGRLAYGKTATMLLRIYSRGTDIEGVGTLNLQYTSTRAQI